MLIGNKNKIAFDIQEKRMNQILPLELYIGNKLISNEPVFVPTYLSSLDDLSMFIQENRFQNESLSGIKTKDLFTKLFSERDSNEKQFFKHLIRLDESLDQYSIFAFQDKEDIILLWNCWDENNCNNDHNLNEIYSVKIKTDFLIETLDLLASKINKTHANN